jgi:hypothetical protein
MSSSAEPFFHSRSSFGAIYLITTYLEQVYEGEVRAVPSDVTIRRIELAPELKLGPTYVMAGAPA